GPQLRETVVGPAGGADDGVDAVAYAEVEVAHDRGGGGQLHGHLGAPLDEGLQLVVPAEGGHQFHVVGGLYGPYRLRTDPALGAEDGHAQLAHVLRFLTGRGQATASCRRDACLSLSGPMTDREGRRPRTARATERTSSGVTEAIRASMSSTDICSPQHSSLLPIRFISAPVSSRPRTVEPLSWPMARSISSSGSPCSATWSSSSRQIFSTSCTWEGRHPAYTPNRPQSAKPEV